MKVPEELECIAPTRYFDKTVEIGFWEALGRFLKHGKWSWYKVEFTAVFKGDPGYEKAPYESQIIWMSK